MASKALYGAQYGRTDAMLANNFEARKKDDKQLGMLNIQLLGAKTPEQKQKVLTDINARENQIKNEMLGIAGGGGSGSISSALPTSTPSMADRGFRILGTE